VPDEAAEGRLRRWLDALSAFSCAAPTRLEDDLSERVVAILTAAGPPPPLPVGVRPWTHSGIVLLSRPSTRELLPCFVLAPSETPTPGFLCGDVVLRPHPDLLRAADGAQVVQAVGRAVLQARRENPPVPAAVTGSSFLRDVWEALGPDLLWPSRGTAVDCLAGQVGASRVAVRFGRGSRQLLELTFHPGACGRPGRTGGTVALRHRSLDRAHDSSCVGVIDACRRRLSASTGNGEEATR
jgi:hypothetical protein